LIWIKPADEGVLNFPVTLPIVFGKLRRNCRAFRNHLESPTRETNMKISIALSALLIGGFMAATTEPANAVVYCQYVEYPAGCTVRAGVVLRPRPVARAVATPGVGRVGTPTNRGGPVDRAGRR
jgi:hypothetical protein